MPGQVAQIEGTIKQLESGIEQSDKAVDQLDEQITQVTDQQSETADSRQTQQELTDEQKSIADGQKALAEDQQDLADLRAGAIRVKRVADIKLVLAPTTVTQIKGDPSVTITATPDTTDLGALSATVTTTLAGINDLPAGVSAELGGAATDQQEAFSQLGLAMLVAIALVFLIMVGTFRSLVQPLILMVAIPFAATGAIAGLLITDTPLGVPAMVGLLMLIGIVVTNAIVLIDLINQYRAKGEDLRTAIVDGARLRLRPIIMTATATIFALIPMGLGPDRWRRLHLAATGHRGDRGSGVVHRLDPAAGAGPLLAGRATQREEASSGPASGRPGRHPPAARGLTAAPQIRRDPDGGSALLVR